MSDKAIQTLKDALHPQPVPDDFSIGTVIKWASGRTITSGIHRYAAIKTSSLDWHTTYDDISGAVSFDRLVTLLIEMKAENVAVSDPAWSSWEWKLI